MNPTSARRRFCLVLVKPSHYDDDGYVIQWLRSPIPSNSLAALYGIAQDCADRKVLGPDVDLEIHAFDETNTRIRPERLAALIEEAGAGMVMMVGVQSNQFPRALDLARPLRARGLAVAIGGFHVSGVLSMLGGVDKDLDVARQMGLSLFAGEAEGRLDDVLQDAAAGQLKPLYNYMNDLPSIEGAPIPLLAAERVRRTAGNVTTLDAGRGCPYQCSFCTIINVQGRKSRRRSPDDVEHIVRTNYAQGLRSFFITDDNFARNKDWELILDRLIYLREVEKLNIGFIIQVDTLCHKEPRFIEKCARAGVRRVFIGLENISPDNLAGAKKKQNKITEYRAMLLAWKAARVITYAGYILGFPNDTPEKILRDIDVIKRELPVDLLEFFYLTPLPGSEDHLKLVRAGATLDPDLNKYDLNHICTPHPKMSDAEWNGVYKAAWQHYYTTEHITTILKRVAASGGNASNALFLITWFKGSIDFEKIHPLEAGFLRLKFRRDRRPTMPRESVFAFYPRYWTSTVSKLLKLGMLYLQLRKIYLQIKRDPNKHLYTDMAMSAWADDSDAHDLFDTDDARAYVGEQKRLQAVTAGRRSSEPLAATGTGG
ncbi:radical SAM protein [Rhodopseudomonas sp. B29]|uniref:B12-binding domain-containing radical SAM protein n=1 Tax=Rhodopseudomonas sp. B29 TaxID=95607 RepID=UPI00034D5117|nr:radical SAM protein [Rhodopseudomonas sp. B29]